MDNESNLDDTEDITPSIHHTETYFKKKIPDSNIMKTPIPHETISNNCKTGKYFSDINDDSTQKALENYEKILKSKYKTQKNKKTLNSINSTKSYSKIKRSKKSSSINIDKEILKYAEPRSKKKYAYKIKPKNFDNIFDNDTDDEGLSENYPIYKNNSNNSTEIVESLNESFSSVIYSDNSKNEQYDIKISSNLIFFENLFFMDNLYQELRKDLEMNKMEIFQNKLSIIKDFFSMYYQQNNIILFKAFQEYSEINNTIQRNVKEFLIQQLIFLYIFLIISLIKKEKEKFLSGIKNCVFYFNQSFISFLYILINKSDFTKEQKNNLNFSKCNKILEENQTWLNSSNFKKCIYNNNKTSKQILNNLIYSIKYYFEKNPEEKSQYPFIEPSLNLIKAYLKNIKKSKIDELINEIKENQSIQELIQKTINNISTFQNNTNEEEEEEELEKPIPPFLKPINPKYEYTLVLDLDETLVHYLEDADNAYIQIRPGAEDFIFDLSNYYELIIFTAALQNYADLAIDGLDPNQKISYRLYRAHTIKVGDVNFKDLSKLGRDLKKVIILENNAENYGLQPKNGLKIKDFEGDENDDELDYLKDDLINLAKNHPDDVREYLPKIQDEMNKRNLIYNNGEVVQFCNKDINDNEV